MRWVLMLFVVLAAVMGGEARAVVVVGRVEVSERVGKEETVERESEDALRGASREVVPEVEEVAGLEDAGPLGLWFPGGSAVARSDCGAGQGWARPIEEVGLGDRVLTAEAGGAQESGTAVMDPAVWRVYSLRLTRADGTVTRVDLLRPAGWEHVMTQGPDGRRTIHLELPEKGVSGEAEVLAVSPCPPVEPGVGRVVTGSFRYERNHGLRALHVSVAGEVSCLRVTSGHPVWSVARGAWIGAGELVPGEALAAWRGEPVAVPANLREADTATWNLEVENEHVYRVGPAGILVHNTCQTPHQLLGLPDPLPDGSAYQSAQTFQLGGAKAGRAALESEGLWGRGVQLHIPTQMQDLALPNNQPHIHGFDGRGKEWGLNINGTSHHPEMLKRKVPENVKAALRGAGWGC